MKSTNQNIEELLKDVAQLQEHQKEIERIKGETFNIFSILGVESKENKTHSGFIAELLNPKGSHYMGSIFLKAFLEQIAYKGKLDPDNASVIKEYHVGKRKSITGGRIDIFITDKAGNCISIENKICAGDQENQLIRYYNYRKGKNMLFYLSLDGSDPSEHSTKHVIDDKNKIVLKRGNDYHILSYEDHILAWLDRCHQLAVDVPQLRYSIKQYILLIKKITYQMVDPKSKEIKEKLFKYSESAEFIASNFQSIKNDIKEKFRADVAQELRKKKDEKLFNFVHPNSVHTKGFAQIYVELKNYHHSEIQILIESFSGYGNHNNQMYIGVYDHSGKKEDFPISGNLETLNTSHWKSAKIIYIENKAICLEDLSFLKKIVDPESDTYKQIVSEFVNQCVDFINEKYPVIEDYLSKESDEPK